MPEGSTSYALLCRGFQELPQGKQEQAFKLVELEAGLDGIDPRELVKGGILIVRRASSAQELEASMNLLTKEGIDAEIVEDPSPIETVNPKAFQSFYQKYMDGFVAMLQGINAAEVEALTAELVTARRNGKKILLIGNGGSAAIASHAATDLIKERFPDERYLFRAVSLTDNTPVVTATANDFSYEDIFAQQLKVVAEPGDVLVAISSSGNSPNILRAVNYANKRGLRTVGISGFDGGKLRDAVDCPLHIRSKKGQYGYVEDASMVFFHIATIFVYEQDRDTLKN